MAGSYEVDEGQTRFLDQTAGHRILKAHEEVELARRWRNDGDNDARHELVMHNIRLVVSIARNFTGRGLTFSDLINSGIVGLDRASRKFDPEKGYKFSTYASWWIRQAIQRAVSSEGKTIRVPNQVSTRRLQVEAYLRENPDATQEEIAAKLDCTVAQLVRAQGIAEVVASLDQEFTSEASQTTLLESISDPRSEDPYETVTNGSSELYEGLEQLEDLPRQVLALRFGLGTDKEHTLQEIATALDVPLKSVQAAQREGLAKLRDIMSPDVV